MSDLAAGTNFHHAAEIAGLADLLSCETDDRRVAILAGAPGSGRRFLVRSAVQHARERGLPVLHATIDLDGFEPAAGSLEPYLSFQLSKAGRAEPELLQAGSALDSGRLDDVLTAAILAGRDAQSGQLASRLLAGGLGALAHPASPNERIVLHAADLTDASLLLRERLLGLAADNPRIGLAFSCQRTQDPARAARGREAARFETPPLDPGELRQFAPDRDDLDALHARSGGNRGLLAALLRDDPLTDPLQAAQLPEQERDFWRAFLHIAALCGDNIPVRALLAHLGVDGEEEQEESIDRLDEIFGADSPTPVFADRFQHPSFPGEQIYGFAQPFIPQALLQRLTAASREYLARELVGALARRLAPVHRAAARLFLDLTTEARMVQDQREFERELSFWTGPAETDALTRLLENEIRSGARSPNDLWLTVNSVQTRWPPYRTLAVLDAIPPQVLHPELEPGRRAIRAGLLLDAERFEEARSEALSGLEACRDPMLESALLDRIGAAEQRLGQTAQAEQRFARSRELRTRMLETGDPRVEPLVREQVRILRRAGRNGEAAALEEKLAKSQQGRPSA